VLDHIPGDDGIQPREHKTCYPYGGRQADAEEGHGAKVAPAGPEETAPSTLKPGVGGLVALDLEDSQTVVSLTLLWLCIVFDLN